MLFRSTASRNVVSLGMVGPLVWLREGRGWNAHTNVSEGGLRDVYVLYRPIVAGDHPVERERNNPPVS